MSKRIRSFLSGSTVKIVALLLVLTLFPSCSPSKDEQLIERIKNGTLGGYEGKNIAQAANGFFGNPKWSAQRDNEGKDYVTVEGDISYLGKKVSAALQFKIDKNNDSFEVNALEFNGIPQGQDMIKAFIEKMYETSSTATSDDSE